MRLPSSGPWLCHVCHFLYYVFVFSNVWNKFILDVAVGDPQPSLDLEDNYGEAVVPQPVSHCVSEIYL